MRSARYIKAIVAAVFCAAILAGCASVQEKFKGIAGVSTKVLEDDRPNSASTAVQRDYNTCYLMTKTILDKIKAYIYAENTQKHLIAIYVSEQDTTPVGIFFKEVSPNVTQIDVSSPSSYAKHFIADKLFSALEEKPNQ